MSFFPFKRFTASPKPWDLWRERHGFAIPGRPWHSRTRSGLAFGCSKESPLEATYARMAAGDTNALEAARRLADKENAGTATASEMAALWGLRALAEANGANAQPNAQTNASAMQLLTRAGAT